MCDISIIIPFLNEEENLPLLFEKLEESFSKVKEKIQVIFVDDGSTDQSLELLKAYKPANFSKKIIKLSKNYGSHAAIRSGLLYCDGDFSTFLSADLQEDPVNISDFYRYCVNSSADVAILYREENKSTLFEKVFSKIYVKLVRLLVASNFPDKNITNFIISNKVRQILNNNIMSNSSIFLQIFSLGFKQVFIPYEQFARHHGKSKWTFSKKVKLFVDSFVSFSYTPLRFITIAGFTFFILGVLYLLFILANYLLAEKQQTGWPSIISVILIGFGFTNISLGVISEYLWRIFDNSKKSPVFIVEEVYE